MALCQKINIQWDNTPVYVIPNAARAKKSHTLFQATNLQALRVVAKV